jgi:PAS domain S-box-containing protein
MSDSVSSKLRKQLLVPLLLGFIPFFCLLLSFILRRQISLLQSLMLLIGILIPFGLIYLCLKKQLFKPVDLLYGKIGHLRQGGFCSNASVSTPPGTLTALFQELEQILSTHVQRQIAADEAYAIIDNSPIVAFIWRNSDGWPVDFVTENIKREFGYDSHELLLGSVRFLQMVHPDDRERVIEEVTTHSAQGEADSFVHKPYRILTVSGEIRWVDDCTYVRRNDCGEITHYYGMLLDISERIETLEGLKRNANFTQALLHAVPIPVFYKDDQGLYQGCNEAFSEIMGVTEAEIRGKRVDELWPIALAGIYHQADLDLLQHPQHQVYESEIRDKTGKSREVVFAKDVYRDEEGRAAGVVGSFLDISGIKAAQQSLAETNRMLQLVLNTIPVRVFWKDRQCVYQGCNQAFAQDAGVSSTEEIVGKTDFDLAFVRQAELFRSDDSAVMDSGESRLFYEEPQDRPDGKQTWLLTSKVPICDAGQEVTGVLGTYQDITDRKLTEEELLKLRRYLANIFDSMPSLLVAVDRDLRVTQWNAMAESITGLKAEDLLGQALDEVCPLFAADIDKIKNSLATKTVVRDTDRTVSDASGVHFYDLTVFPLVERSVEGAVIRLDDVTQKHCLQEQLNHKSKMDAIGHLAGGVAHDFNNMLSGIVGITELLKLQVPSNAKVESLFEMLIKTSERAAGLTQNLLAFARKQHLASTAVDMHDVIQSAVELLEKTIDKRVSIVFLRGDEQGRVFGDPSQLQNVIVNMGINAAHAMPDGGLFEISTNCLWLDELYCSSTAFDISPGFYLQVQVKDNGCGIDADILPHIFEPFYTTKKQGEGSGLGLAAVFGTVEQHRGAISVHSTSGEGTVFNLFLPLTEEEILPQLLPVALEYRTGTILVVDDEEIMRITVELLLENLGYRVLLVENGQEAVDLFRERRAEIDLVLLDMIMPVMNGKDCFTALQQIDPEVPVIMTSGFSDEGDVSKIRERGLFGFLNKPYRAVELSREVARAIDFRNGSFRRGSRNQHS